MAENKKKIEKEDLEKVDGGFGYPIAAGVRQDVWLAIRQEALSDVRTEKVTLPEQGFVDGVRTGAGETLSQMLEGETPMDALRDMRIDG